MFHKVNATLAVLNLVDEYQEKFKSHRLNDAHVEFCMRKGSIDETLKGVIEKEEDRSRFKIAFNNPQFAARSSSDNISTIEIPGKAEMTEPSTRIRCPDVSTFNGTKKAAVDSKTTHPPQVADDAKPLQIMKFKQMSRGKPFKVVCDEEALRSIVAKTGNCPVVVLVIAGPTRQGKSFFLNFLLRRLYGIQNDEVDWMGWTHPTEPLVGFEWKANYSHVTDGIWMRSEPFTLTSKQDGSKFDLLLMDSQGVFDSTTREREWSILMGLNLLTSSCLLYNKTQNIDEKDLIILDEFLTFGEMALQDKNNTGKNKRRPFQNLTFLVRDWNNPGEYPYGFEGGQDFIDEVLQPQDHHLQESLEVREKLGKCFNHISCILLPHPGQEVIQTNYNGSIASCQTFAAVIEKAVDDILFGGNLPPKQINGNTLTGKDIFDLFKTYINLFNEDRMLTCESIYYATSKACNAAVVANCVSKFIELVQQQLDQVHIALDYAIDEILKTERQGAMDLFEHSRKMGSRRIINEADDNLAKLIQVEFANLKSNYMIKREQTILSALGDAVLKYEAIMEPIISDDTFRSAETLQQTSLSAEREAFDLFNALLKLTKDDDLPSEKAKLLLFIQSKFQNFQTMNDNKKVQAEKLMRQEISQYRKSYAETMTEKINDRILSKAKMDKQHAKISSLTAGDFTQKHLASPLLSSSLQLLSGQMGEEFKIMHVAMTLARKESMERAEAVFSEALVNYTEKMVNENPSDLTEFNNTHNNAKSAALEVLTNSEILLKEMLSEWTARLQFEIYNAYTERIRLFNEKVSQHQNELSMAKKEAKAKYREAMQIFSGDHFVLTDAELESAHVAASAQALEPINEVLINTCVGSSNKESEEVLQKISISLNKILSALLDDNTRKKEEAKKVIEADVENLSKQYTEELKSSLSAEIETCTNIEELHTRICPKIEDKFSQLHHDSPFLEKGMETLKEKLSHQHNLINETLTSLLTAALQHYTSKMGEINPSESETTYQNTHEENMALSIEILQKSGDSIVSKKILDKYENNVKSLIVESFTTSFAEFKQNKVDREEEIRSAEERAKSMYTKGMIIFFKRALSHSLNFS